MLSNTVWRRSGGVRACGPPGETSPGALKKPVSAVSEALRSREYCTGLSRMCLQRSPSCAKIVSSVEVVTDVINRGQDYLERR
jgi:hypothetical protein